MKEFRENIKDISVLVRADGTVVLANKYSDVFKLDPSTLKDMAVALEHAFEAVNNG